METTIKKCSVCFDEVGDKSGFFLYDNLSNPQLLCPEHAHYIERLIGDLSEDFECNA